MLKMLFGLALLLHTTMLGAKQIAPSIPHPFQDDLSVLDCHFSALTQLEQHVEASGHTHSQLQAAAHPMAYFMLPDTAIGPSLLGASDPERELLLDVPGFLWGLCCSATGVLLVYLLIDEPAIREREVYAAIRGCTIGTLLAIGLYVWFAYYASYY